MVDSYFKIVSPDGMHTIITFAPEDIRLAWQKAQELVRSGDTVSMYRPAVYRGEWDQTPIIGHRSRAAIMQDISMTASEEELSELYEELAAVPGGGFDN